MCFAVYGGHTLPALHHLDPTIVRRIETTRRYLVVSRYRPSREAPDPNVAGHAASAGRAQQRKLIQVILSNLRIIDGTAAGNIESNRSNTTHTHTESHIQLLDNCCAEQSIKIEVSAVFFIASYTDKTARNAPVSVA